MQVRGAAQVPRKVRHNSYKAPHSCRTRRDCSGECTCVSVNVGAMGPWMGGVPCRKTVTAYSWPHLLARCILTLECNLPLRKLAKDIDIRRGR